MDIHGRCHCGNIAFALAWEPDPAEIPARACDCTFCVKHGGVWTSHPAGRLRVSIADDAAVSRYTFGTRTATFHICARCGVPPVATSEIEGVTYAVVNVNTFEDVHRARLKPAAVTYEGEDQAARLARRKQRWIGSVAFTKGETA